MEGTFFSTNSFILLDDSIQGKGASLTLLQCVINWQRMELREVCFVSRYGDSL